MDERLFTHLKETANKLLENINQVNHLLASISKKELSIFPDQSLKDLGKVQMGTTHLNQAVTLFISTTLPFLKDSTDLTAQLVNIRHDLRTPVNAIKGYGELIMEDLQSNNLIELTVKFSSIIGLSIQILRHIDSIKETALTNKNNVSAQQVKQDIMTAEFKTSSQPSPNKPTLKLSSRVGSLLIVDDVEENRSLLCDWVQRRHYEFYAVASGEDALAFLEKNAQIDIVLLDIMMPGMDGFEVLNRIKHNPNLSNLIVIMISALEELDSIVRCIKNGADDYLVKPFNAYLLDARISACLEKKRLRDSEKAYLLALQEELSIAQKIQSSMLPIRIPVSNYYNIYGRSVPAKEVGGDFYDWYELGDGKLGFCVGDVSGKGISAALFMAVSRTVLNTLVNIQSSAAQSMSETNTQLLRNNESLMFVTLFYGILDIQTGQLIFVNAGHWQPILIKKSGEQIPLIGSSGPAAGVIEDIQYLEFKVNLEAGDTLFMYTDGVTEAVNKNYESFGLLGLQQSLQRCWESMPKKQVETVIHDVLKFTADEDIFDDITCLSLHINGR